MGTARHIGRVGAVAVALGIGSSQRRDTRMTVSTAPSRDSVTSVEPVPTVRGGEAVADSTALIMGGTTVPTLTTPTSRASGTSSSRRLIRARRSTTVAVTTPKEFWPITGLGPRRLASRSVPRDSGGLVARVAG